MKKCSVIKILVLLFILFLSRLHSFDNQDQRITAVFHVHSEYSYDCHESIEEIAIKAKNKGVDAVFFTDHDFIELEYRFLPFNLGKVSVSRQSVFKSGVDKYFNEIETVNARYPNMFLFPGVESSPYYYWTKEDGTLLLKDWHKHLVVTGLTRESLKKIPVLANTSAKAINPLAFWPVVLIIIGILFIKGIIFKKIGIIMIIFALYLLYLNYPFRISEFDPMSGRSTLKPYQELVDYVSKEKGLVFLAHPEASNKVNISGGFRMKGFDYLQNKTNALKLVGLDVRMDTGPYYEDLKNVYNYDGFAVFWSGYEKTGNIGGIWDQVLNEYLIGKRNKPVWAFGELDYRKEGEAGTFIDSVRNIVFVKEKTKEAILDALKNGQFYVLEKGTYGHFPEILELNIGRRIIADIEYNDRISRPLTVNIVKNGVLFKSIQGDTPIKINEENTISNEKEYIRLEILSAEDGSKIITNPVFFGGKK